MREFAMDDKGLPISYDVEIDGVLKVDAPNKVTRFEVIDHRSNLGDRKGRALVAMPASVELVYQDGGKTLKVFLTDVDDPDEVSKDYATNFINSLFGDSK